MPTTVIGALLVVSLFVPGYLTLVIFNRRQAWTPRPDLQLFAESVVISAFCHLPLYWVVPRLLSWSEIGELTQAGPLWTLLGWFLGVAVVIPTLLGLVASWRLDDPKGTTARWIAKTFALDRVGRAPTAWDAMWGTVTKRGAWVSVKVEGGGWVGGKFGKESAVAFWKEGHDLFLEEEWTTDDLGRFDGDAKKVASGQGVWLEGSSIRAVRLSESGT